VTPDRIPETRTSRAAAAAAATLLSLTLACASAPKAGPFEPPTPDAPTDSAPLAAATPEPAGTETTYATASAAPVVPASPALLERTAQRTLAEDPAKAEALFAEIVASHPTRSSALLGLGLARLAQEDAVGAVGTLERARGLDRSARITATLAVAYDALGRHDQAQRLYREALEREPEDVETLNNLGVSYTRTERFREAVYVFRGALTLRPENPGLENNLGYALGRMGRYDDAAGHFRSAGTPSEALNNLGYVAFLNGDDARAISYYESALAVAEDDALTIIRNLRAARERHEAHSRPPLDEGDRSGDPRVEVGALGEVPAWQAR
jgi:Flp pilus assembly protein TadD